MTLTEKALSPLRHKAETDSDKGKSNRHVPVTKSADRQIGIDVIRHDPAEANEKVCEHYRDEPTWALTWKYLDSVNLLFMSVLLLDLFTQFRLWHRR